MTTVNKVIIGLVAVALVIVIVRGAKNSLPGGDSNLGYGDTSTEVQPQIYSGVESRFGFQANIAAPGGGSYQTTLITYNWVLLPDGSMYKKLPGDGDIAGYCGHQETGNPCLSYRIDGDTLTISGDDGSRNDFAIDDDGITFKPKVILKKVEVVTPQLLSAKWHRSNFAQSTGYGGNVGVASEQQIYFDTDGNFATKQFSGFTASGSFAGGYQNRKDIDQGTYSLDGYFITFKFQDGFEAKHVIFKYPGEELISIDGKNFIQ